MIAKGEFKSIASLSFSEYKKITLLVYIWNGTAHGRHVPLGHSEHFLNRGANKENSCSPQSFDTSGLSNYVKAEQKKESREGETVKMKRYSIFSPSNGFIMTLQRRDSNKTILLSKLEILIITPLVHS